MEEIKKTSAVELLKMLVTAAATVHRLKRNPKALAKFVN